MMRLSRFFTIFGTAVLLAGCTDVLVSPKTVVDRTIEARSGADIALDNKAVIRVNAAMAKFGLTSVSTEIYEQRLLITGVIADRTDYDGFEKSVREIGGIRQIYWHVRQISNPEQKRRIDEGAMLEWPDVLLLQGKGKARLIGTRGVADVNFRVAADSFGTLYFLGRARSAPEKSKALARVRDGRGVKQVIDYVIVRP